MHLAVARGPHASTPRAFKFNCTCCFVLNRGRTYSTLLATSVETQDTSNRVPVAPVSRSRDQTDIILACHTLAVVRACPPSRPPGGQPMMASSALDGSCRMLDKLSANKQRRYLSKFTHESAPRTTTASIRLRYRPSPAIFSLSSWHTRYSSIQ
jgi:hypothetical protein